MQQLKFRILLVFCVLAGGLWLGRISSARASWLAQQPTVDIPTVTSSPSGTMAIVRSDSEEKVNLRAGPSSTDYPIVGFLIVGQKVPALGRSPGGDWIKVAYPGVPGGAAWIYAPLVDLTGELPVVEPPPTPTPRTTPTIDPTLAAQFVVQIPPTRLPTFTPPPPLIIPTIAPIEPIRGTAGVPMGFVIIGLGVLGLFGIVISLLRGR